MKKFILFLVIVLSLKTDLHSQENEKCDYSYEIVRIFYDVNREELKKHTALEKYFEISHDTVYASAVLGTGFFISKNLFVTTHHGLGKKYDINHKFYNSPEFPVNQIYKQNTFAVINNNKIHLVEFELIVDSSNCDISLFKVKNYNSDKIIPLANEIDLSKKTCSSGFPEKNGVDIRYFYNGDKLNIQKVEQHPSLYQGFIHHVVDTNFQDEHQYHHSIKQIVTLFDSKKGDSGSPLIQDGKLIGMLTNNRVDIATQITLDSRFIALDHFKSLLKANKKKLISLYKF